MALRNFPHADANGDGMLNAAEMERAGLTPVEMERVDDEMLSPRRYAEIIAARSRCRRPPPPSHPRPPPPPPPRRAPVDARRAPSAWGGAATALLQLSEANANATAASATPAPAAAAAAAAAAAVAARFAAIRLGQEQAGTKESAAAAAAAAYPPSMYAGALKVIDELIYYTTYADEAIAELGSFAIGITEHAECRTQARGAARHARRVRRGGAGARRRVDWDDHARVGRDVADGAAPLSRADVGVHAVADDAPPDQHLPLDAVARHLVDGRAPQRAARHIDKWAATELLPKTYWG